MLKSASLAPFTAALLAGGRSVRMGADKAALLIGGEPLWRRQLGTLRALDPDELLVSGREDGPFAGAGVAIVADATPGLGPLGGIAALLRAMKCERLLVLAVDMPAMTPAYLCSLLAACAPGRGVVPMAGDAIEPLAAVYPRACVPLVAEVLCGADHSMRSFVQLASRERLIDLIAISAADRVRFRNLNTPSDLVEG